MRLIAFVSGNEESKKAREIIANIAALHPELQVEYLPFPSRMAERNSVAAAPTVFIEGRKVFEGRFTREQLLDEIRRLRPSVSRLLGEPKPEREEAFE